jgi:hypothetical protein
MPLNPNMKAIQTITVGAGGASTIDFQNIPQTYTDLVIYLSARQSTTSFQGQRLYFNNTDTNLRSNYLLSTGSGTQANAAATGYFGSVAGTNVSASIFDNTFIYISNYSSTSLVKTYSVDNVAPSNASLAYLGISNGTWNSTSAITRVTLFPDGGGSYTQYSSATIYGVTSSAYTAKATGGIITEDNTYWYHTFYSTGVFTPNQTISADYLVVAGGGGGGSTFGDWGGGPGGAGGYRTFTGVSFTATNYAVTIGAGGTSTAGAGSTGGKGGNSSVIGGAISSTSTGGGGGGTTKENGGVQTNGQAGGSGGGAPQNTVSVSAGTGNQGGYSPVEGYAGGAVNGSSPYIAGQGGGSSAVGLSNSAQSPTGIATTNGTSNSISGTSVVYSRGGYFIVSNTGSLNGPANSGWGGLTSNPNGANGAGGSGIVIIRYAK